MHRVLHRSPTAFAALALALAAGPAFGDGNELAFDFAPFDPGSVAGEVWNVSTVSGVIVRTRIEAVLVVEETGPWSFGMWISAPTGVAGVVDSTTAGWSGAGTFPVAFETDALNGPVGPPGEGPFWSWFLHWAGGTPVDLPGGGVGLVPLDGVFTTLSITFELAPCPGGDPARPWTVLGGAVAGGAGPPTLSGAGSACAGEPATLTVAHGAPGAPAFLVAGATELALPLLGGLLVPSPDVVFPPALLDAAGGLQQTFPYPAGVPTGTPLWLQHWLVDATAPAGLAATNGLLVTAP